MQRIKAYSFTKICHVSMKKIFFSCLLGLFWGVVAAQGVAQKEAPTAFYTIQLGSFDESVKQTDFAAIRGYAYVYRRNGIVYMGQFPTEEAAEPILQKIRPKGYEDALVIPRSLAKAKTVYTIQLATMNVSENINWVSFAKAGTLYTLPVAGQVRISQGAYDDKNEANMRLKELQDMGFTDAFVKGVKDIQLNLVDYFDTGRRDLTFVTPKNVPTPYNTRPSGTTSRKGVMKLQESLKFMSLYGGALDGVMGEGTETAYTRALLLNRRLRFFNELAVKTEGFDGWEDVRLLLTMTRELSTKENPQAIVPDLLNNLPEAALSKTEADNALNWHDKTWKNLQAWSLTSGYNEQIYTALKVAYYHSLTHLEDVFKEKGVTATEATPLALSVLKTLIGTDLQSFNQ